MPKPLALTAAAAPKPSELGGIDCGLDYTKLKVLMLQPKDPLYFGFGALHTMLCERRGLEFRYLWQTHRYAHIKGVSLGVVMTSL